MNTLSSKSIIEIEREYRLLKQAASSGGDEVRIALLSSFTLMGLEAALGVGAGMLGLDPEIFTGGYNQYAQELLDKDGPLWKFKPDMTLLLLDAVTLLGPRYSGFAAADAREKEKWCDETADRILQLAGSADATGKTTLLLGSVIFPPYSPYGLTDPGRSDGVDAFARGLDERTAASVRDLSGVVFFDLKGAVAEFGWRSAFDPRLYYMGSILLRPDFMPFLAQKLLGFVAAKKGLGKKCIIVDLDNTLWGGIVGEDGVGGIQFGDGPAGGAYRRIQEILLDYNRRGIVLAVCSKNNEADFRDAFEKREDMVLKLENFAAWRVNWADKARNIEELAAEINIGLDSMVFLDDSPLERDWVRRHLPEVEVPEPPQDPALWPDFLRALPWFDNLGLTGEDAIRSRSYALEKKRAEHRNRFEDIDGFLADLNMEIEVKPLDDGTLPRASQLTLRTNQFNLCVRRCTIEEMRDFAGMEENDVLTFRVRDRYGDYGIVGLIMGRASDDRCYMVENFLLSCRALGRRVEETMFEELTALARRRKCSVIRTGQVETPKNKPARDFFEKHPVAGVRLRQL